MINRLSGDSILFEQWFQTDAGTGIATGTVTFTAVDNVGSAVYTGTGTFESGSTWAVLASTSGWATGPVSETWVVKAASGTFTKIRKQSFRVVGTDFFESYIGLADLRGYYENIDDYFDNSSEELLNDSWRHLNSRLQSLGYKFPILTGTDGLYDQALRDWNGYEAVYRIVSRRAASRQGLDESKAPWYQCFKDRSEELWKDFKNHKIVLNSQTSVSESGINPPTKTTSNSYAHMENNWEGFGNGFQGGDYPRTWYVKVIGTGSPGLATSGTVIWSRNGGLSYEGTVNTNLDWVLLADEVYVRFFYGTEAGTTGTFGTSDLWTFTTAPNRFSAGGKNSVRSY